VGVELCCVADDGFFAFRAEMRLILAGTTLPLDSAPAYGCSVERLIAKAVVIEFLAIAVACLLTSFVYFQLVFSGLPPIDEYS
jgi:hypothetical protein